MKAVNFIENHLMEDIGAEDAAAAVSMSVFYLHKGFGMVTGYTLKEYIRCRRLYLAALDVLRGEEKIIDLAYKYGYETPESFTKAFSRFHGVPPRGSKRMRAGSGRFCRCASASPYKEEMTWITL